MIMAYVKSTAAGGGCLRQTAEWRPKTRIFMGTRIALHIRALCRYTVATAFPHHCGKGFPTPRNTPSGRMRNTVRNVGRGFPADSVQAEETAVGMKRTLRTRKVAL